MMFAPPLVQAAIAPEMVSAFGMRLNSLTLAHLLRIEKCGAAEGLLHGKPTLKSILAGAGVLAMSGREALGKDVPQVAGKAAGNWDTVLESALRNMSSEEIGTEAAKVQQVIREAFAPYLPTRRDGEQVVLDKPTLGMVAQLLDFLMATYGMRWEVALCEVPVSLAFVLMAAASQRDGAKFAAPDYFEQLEMSSAATASDLAAAAAETEKKQNNQPR